MKISRLVIQALCLLGLWLGLGLKAHAQTDTVTYVYTDPQGTPLVEADAQGNVIARYDYTPYGNAVASLGSPANGPGYTGHVNDPDTGLVYMQARYYDPSVGRFLSTDPVGPSPGNPSNFNRYDYASNNPVVNMDPDGRCSSTDGFPCEEFVSGDNGGGGAHTASAPVTHAQSASSTSSTNNNQSSDLPGTLSANGNHSKLTITTVDPTKWRLAAVLQEGGKQSFPTLGGIIVQPSSVSGPFHTNAFWFTVSQIPLNSSGGVAVTAAPHEWFEKQQYSSGGTGGGAEGGYQFFAPGGIYGNKWTISYPVQDDWNQNATNAGLNIYVPMHN